MELSLYIAAQVGRSQEVSLLLGKHRSLNVNWHNLNDDGRTPLQAAARRGHTAVVRILLAHPGIDVNSCDSHGNTPFMSGCWAGKTSCVRALLRDTRVSLNQRNTSGFTPLYWLVYYTFIESIKWWVASGRDMDMGEPENPRSNVLHDAIDRGKIEVKSLLERYRANPGLIRKEIRLELHCDEGLEAEMFALVVFLCDGLLEVTTTPTPADRADEPLRRFLAIVRQLPMELQMVMCNRWAGVARTNIASQESELAFRNLAWKLLTRT